MSWVILHYIQDVAAEQHKNINFLNPCKDIGNTDVGLCCLISLIRRLFTVPATCWGFIGPVFIRKGSPASNARIGSLTSALWVCGGFPPLFSWMISSKWASSPLAETPFWWAAGWTPFTTGADALCDGLRTAELGLCRFPAASEW